MPNAPILKLFGEMAMVTIKKKLTHNPLSDYFKVQQKEMPFLPNSPENLLEGWVIFKTMGEFLDLTSKIFNLLADICF